MPARVRPRGYGVRPRGRLWGVLYNSTVQRDSGEHSTRVLWESTLVECRHLTQGSKIWGLKSSLSEFEEKGLTHSTPWELRMSDTPSLAERSWYTWAVEFSGYTTFFLPGGGAQGKEEERHRSRAAQLPISRKQYSTVLVHLSSGILWVHHILPASGRRKSGIEKKEGKQDSNSMQGS